MPCKSKNCKKVAQKELLTTERYLNTIEHVTIHSGRSILNGNGRGFRAAPVALKKKIRGILPRSNIYTIVLAEYRL